MRLIDVDLYCATICKCNRRECDKAKCPIHNAPTAYDIDKVVEELEIERKTANNTYNSFNMDVDLGRVFGLEKAIEIVKQGGVYEADQKLKEMGV